MSVAIGDPAELRRALEQAAADRGERAHAAVFAAEASCTSGHRTGPVGAEYCVASCDQGVFVDEAAEPIPPENAHIRRGCGWIGTSGAQVLVQPPVRPVVSRPKIGSAW